MKAKTNLELFYNEIEWTIKHSDNTAYYTLYRTLFDIYYRETGAEKSSSMFDMLKWYADVPHETLELSKEIYDFLKAYNDEFMSEESSINSYMATYILIDIGIIPKKYMTYKVGDFMKIIKVKKESNK